MDIRRWRMKGIWDEEWKRWVVWGLVFLLSEAKFFWENVIIGAPQPMVTLSLVVISTNFLESFAWIHKFEYAAKRVSYKHCTVAFVMVWLQITVQDHFSCFYLGCVEILLSLFISQCQVFSFGKLGIFLQIESFK